MLCRLVVEAKEEADWKIMLYRFMVDFVDNAGCHIGASSVPSLVGASPGAAPWGLQKTWWKYLISGNGQTSVEIKHLVELMMFFD